MNGDLKKCTVATLFVSMMILLVAPSTDISAYSPSFLIQEVPNPSKNWSSTFPMQMLYAQSGETIPTMNAYVNACRRVTLPDIIGESYISDGKILDGTLWLTNFTKPSLGTDPKWYAMTFEMTIQIVDYPSYNNGSNYQIQILWNYTSPNQWTQKLYELQPLAFNPKKQSISKIPYNPEMNLLETKDYHRDFSNHDYVNGSHVDIPLNLSIIGYPKNVLVDSAELLYYGTSNVSMPCALKEVTRWVPLPPPKISFYTNDTSLVLRPGDTTDIEVHATSSSAIPSIVGLNPVAPSADWRDLHFIPKKIYLSPSSRIGTSTLHITVPQNISNTAGFVIPVDGNVTFPFNTTDTSTGRYINGTQSEALPIGRMLVEVIVKPYTLNDIVTGWITPITALWTLLAGVCAVVGPMVIGLYRKKKDNKDSKPVRNGNTDKRSPI